jgi:hypothetical protein
MKETKELTSFEDLQKYMEPYRKIVEDEMAKKQRLMEGVEQAREEIIKIDGEILKMQDKLNTELTSQGKATEKTLDVLAVLRAKHQSLEETIIALKTSFLPKIDENIRLAEVEMSKALELALDQHIRPFYATLINSKQDEIDRILEEWFEGARDVVYKYGLGFDSINQHRLRKMSGIKPQSDLLSRVS